MKQTKWFDRQFPIIQDNGLLPTIIERLEGTPARLSNKVQQTDFTPINAVNEGWSVKRETGHLLDLEPLWLERAFQIINNIPQLEAADLTNKKTNEANHDERNIMDLITEFKESRQRFIRLLRNLKDEDLQKASLHPRIGTLMKIVDLAYFVAEHDDHHLAKITSLSQHKMTENLFSYGTLQSASVQLKTFGRTLEGHPDVLIGYKFTLIKIENEALIALSGMTHHQNITYTGNQSDAISGIVFIIKGTELKQADEYEEVSGYKRIRVELKSGKTAWVFVSSNTPT